MTWLHGKAQCSLKRKSGKVGASTYDNDDTGEYERHGDLIPSGIISSHLLTMGN